MGKKIHWRALRLFNNAGIDFPVCYSQAALLDMDKAHLSTTRDRERITCRHCKRIVAKDYWS